MAGSVTKNVTKLGWRFGVAVTQLLYIEPG